MRVVGLISGGKDSCYNLIECLKEGHDIVALGNLKPAEKDELDSFMFQTVGHDVIDLYADAIRLPLFRRTIAGSSICQELDYDYSNGDEVEDLFLLLKEIQQNIDFDAVAVGAILSDYQRIRVENVCLRLGIKCLAYLWRRDQDELLQSMIDGKVNAVLIKVAALGLYPQKHLMQTIEDMQISLRHMNAKYGLNICGEGGEYETMTLDCPIFLKRIIVDKSEIVIHSDDAFAPVGYVKFKAVHLEDKGMDPNLSLKQRLIKGIHEDGIFKKQESEVNLASTNNISRKAEMKLNIKELGNPTVKKCGRRIHVQNLFAECGESESVQVATRKALQNLKALLSENGCKMADCVRVHLFLRDMKLFASINEVYKEFFFVNPPARVCVETLMQPNCLFCLDCYALTSGGGDEDCEGAERKTLHVQSISHWAPANIGPYSQAVKIWSTIFVSGSIGLDPGSMKMACGGVEAQAPLALRHIDRILAAIHTSTSLPDAIIVTCFVVSSSDKPAVRQAFCEYPIDTSSMIFETVEIAGLPRDALVEWSVVAHRCQERNITVQQIEKAIGNAKITSKACYCTCGNAGFLSAAVTCEHPLESLDWQEAVSQTIDVLRRITLQSGSKDDLITYQIFYNVQLSENLEYFLGLLKKTHQNEEPATTLIGTQDIEKPLLILGQLK
ncbi:uncharacterized protein LOC135681209 [Rhopilema esculentum]|uniref:uncharacterized protein LOC135681209 n=1 Tax=Rhopilema esculentum TaxID=499914 RepID=UPI0031DC3BAD